MSCGGARCDRDHLEASARSALSRGRGTDTTLRMKPSAPYGAPMIAAGGVARDLEGPGRGDAPKPTPGGETQPRSIEHRRVRVRIPVRVDFAGGWTDVPHFSAREGGAVVNAAINHYVEGSAVNDHGRTHLEYETSIPRGSGLGASAALDVAWLALTDGLMERERSAVELAEAAYRLEKLLGVEGGKQDQYASAIGGFNHLAFGAEEDAAGVETLRLDPTIVAALEERLVLCYTGSAHHSGDLHERVWARLLDGDARIVAALKKIAETVPATKEALQSGDLDALAELLTLNREAARQLHPDVVTPYMDYLFRVASAAGASGSKACGAGGGGCALFLCASGRREAVEGALAAAGARIVPFRFESVSRWGRVSAGGRSLS
jgi:D-glycero-alpha-D-manno-heptose-7-phosphate kinase